jgi:uncharacterized membrane protein YqjE
MTPRNPRDTGLSGSLRLLGATLLALIGARAELIAIELQEETGRARQKLVLLTVAALFLAMGLLLAAFLVVVLFWDTHRMLAAGGVTLFYFCIGGWALVSLREMNRNSPPPFAATLGEFANDLKMLRGDGERHE